MNLYIQCNFVKNAKCDLKKKSKHEKQTLMLAWKNKGPRYDCIKIKSFGEAKTCAYPCTYYACDNIPLRIKVTVDFW